jgi:hypothetical protein
VIITLSRLQTTVFWDKCLHANRAWCNLGTWKNCGVGLRGVITPNCFWAVGLNFCGQIVCSLSKIFVKKIVVLDLPGGCHLENSLRVIVCIHMCKGASFHILILNRCKKQTGWQGGWLNKKSGFYDFFLCWLWARVLLHLGSPSSYL